LVFTWSAPDHVKTTLCATARAPGSSLWSDVDFENRQIAVARSYGRDTTKGGHADSIPIADDLLPFLRDAVDTSPSGLVFPKPDGSMFSQHAPFEDVLRRAMKHAGLVTGYEHVCRVKACGHKEKASDQEQRYCPTHKRKLWVKAEVRPIRFLDLRHTTASLLMMSGANPGAVQKVLRHSSPQITMNTYAHLQPEYLRAEVNRLDFRLAATLLTPEQTKAIAPKEPEANDAEERGNQWWRGRELNPRPTAYETAALTT
jgi:integrase